MLACVQWKSASGGWYWLPLAGLLGLGSPSGVAVAVGWPESLQVHGFLSQGYVNTSDNDWFGDSQDGSWDFREIAVNASLRPLPRLQLSAQLMSRRAGKMYDGDIRLDYGLLDYTAFVGANARAGIRLGRYKNPLGFYNDTRDVPFTRPSIFLPQSIYFDRVRNAELSADGLQLYADWHLDRGDFYLQGAGGSPSVDKNMEVAFLGRNWDGDLEGNDPVWVGRLLYERDGGRVRAALSGLTTSLDFRRGRNDPPPPVLGSGAIPINFWIASLQYNAEKWTLTGEYLGNNISWKDMGLVYANAYVQGDGYYLQGTYQLLPSLELVLRYDVGHSDRHDRDGRDQAERTGLPRHRFFAKDWTLGLRWDPTSELMLRAEYHRIDGTLWLSGVENPDPAGTEREWNMFALQASFRF